MPPWRNILGISAYYHDAAAALVCDGRIVSHAEVVELPCAREVHRIGGERRPRTGKKIRPTFQNAGQTKTIRRWLGLGLKK
jgi:hypothetical protein